MNYYVYYSYEPWGRGYIGKRECKCLPEEDQKYMGSFRDETFKPTEKIILFVCSSREESYEIEGHLHELFKVDKNPHFANKARQTSKKFSFLAFGENNPNYGPGRMPIKSRKSISEKASERLSHWPENPFRNRGENSMSHGRRWFSSPCRTKEVYLKKGEEPPEDWSPGRKKRGARTKESRRKTSESLKNKSKSEEHKKKLKESLLKYHENLKKKLSDG
jgi:hypothetical protein